MRRRPVHGGRDGAPGRVRRPGAGLDERSAAAAQAGKPAGRHLAATATELTLAASRADQTAVEFGRAAEAAF